MSLIQIFFDSLSNIDELKVVISKYGIIYPKTEERQIHPLQHAIRHFPNAAKLLSHRDNILRIGELGYDCVDEAVKEENIELLEIFTKECQDVNFIFPLFLAVHDFKIFKFCVEKCHMITTGEHTFLCKKCSKHLRLSLFMHAVWCNAFEVVDYMIATFPNLIKSCIVIPTSEKMFAKLLTYDIDVVDIFNYYFRTCWFTHSNLPMLFSHYLRVQKGTKYFEMTNLEFDVCQVIYGRPVLNCLQPTGGIRLYDFIASMLSGKVNLPFVQKLSCLVQSTIFEIFLIQCGLTFHVDLVRIIKQYFI